MMGKPRKNGKSFRITLGVRDFVNMEVGDLLGMRGQWGNFFRKLTVFFQSFDGTKTRVRWWELSWENAVKWSSFFAWWWLEPWFFFSIFSRNSWEIHHPNWLHFFFRAVETSNQILLWYDHDSYCSPSLYHHDTMIMILQLCPNVCLIPTFFSRTSLRYSEGLCFLAAKIGGWNLTQLCVIGR